MPLERVLGTEVGAFYRDVHADQGVAMMMGTGVEAFEGGGAVARVRTGTAARSTATSWSSASASRPRTALAEQRASPSRTASSSTSGLDERPGVFAAGDVAQRAAPVLRRAHPRRALGERAPAGAGGGARDARPRDAAYDRLPYFFSDQYDVGMEYTGCALDWDRVVFRGESASREFIAFWLVGGRVVAGMNVNVWDVNDADRGA